MQLSLIPDRAVIFEGGNLSVSFTTDLYPPGTIFRYHLSGLSSSSVPSGLSGTAAIDGSGRARIDVSFAKNTSIDPPKELKLQITGIESAVGGAITAAAKQFQESLGLQGLSVAAVFNERLVYAQGFGVADPSSGELVSPESLFRLASLSKPITSTIVMDLVENGRLSLDAKAIPLLGWTLAPKDARIYDITVRQLLEMSGGWDRDVSGDIAFQYGMIRQNLKVTGEISRQDVIKNALNFATLDFTPGTKYAYSNIGYTILAEIIERITGETYEKATQNLLKLAGITDMRIGATSLSGRSEGEVVYKATQYPVYDSFYMPSFDGAGSWIASAVDLMKFASSVDIGNVRPNLLNPSTYQLLDDRPSFSTRTDYWYGKGWEVDNYGNLFHSGSLPGTSTAIVQYPSGWKFVVLANTNPGDSFYDRVYQTFGPALERETGGSSIDLFKLYDLPSELRSVSLTLKDVPNGYRLLEGSAAADVLRGFDSADYIYGGGGNDRISGQSGSDTVVYGGNRADYTVVRNIDGSYSVTDQKAGRDGVDLLTGVEKIRFSDQDFDIVSVQSFSDLVAANAAQMKAIAAAYQVLLGGVPSAAGFEFLIKNNLSTHYGADAGPSFNEENIYINVANALVQGNPNASVRFSELATGRSLGEKIASLYDKVVPLSKQSADGVAFLTRPEGLKFYQDVAAERGITSGNGAAVTALAALLKVAVDAKTGIGNPVDDLLRSLADGSAGLPSSSATVIPIETVDGTRFDGDDLSDAMPGFSVVTPAVPLIGSLGETFVEV